MRKESRGLNVLLGNWKKKQVNKSEELEWLITLRTTVAFCNEKIEVYVAKNLIPSKQHLDEDEFIDLKAYSLDELKEKIFNRRD